MYSKLIKFSFIAIFSTLFVACGLTPIQNIEQQPVPTNITSAEQVKKAVKLAGASLGWIISKKNSSTLIATLNLRKHQAVIKIPYSKDGYSLIYQSSQNLKYDAESKSIHKNYNSWVRNLNNSIQVNLASM